MENEAATAVVVFTTISIYPTDTSSPRSQRVSSAVYMADTVADALGVVFGCTTSSRVPTIALFGSPVVSTDRRTTYRGVDASRAEMVDGTTILLCYFGGVPGADTVDTVPVVQLVGRAAVWPLGEIH